MKKRPDGRWQKRIKLPDGTSKLFYSKADTEKKALRDFEQQLLAFSSKKEESELLESVADAWECEHFPDIGYNTAAKYRRCLKKIKEFFCGMPITQIEASDVDSFLKFLKKKGLAKDTVSINKSVLSQIFDFAIYNRMLKANPCASVDIPKGLHQEKREPASPEDIQIILRSVDKHFGLYAFTAVLTGMRREELLALTASDINFKSQTIKIDKAVIWTPNQPQIVDTKTGSSTREIYLPELLVPYLTDKTGFIFGDGDKPMSQTQFRRAYARYQKETGLSVTSHQLRHSYATMLYDAEVDVKTAQAQLGHARTSTTQDIYTHIWQSRQQKQMTKIDAYIRDIL